MSDGNFTFPTAQVICAELRCGKVLSVLGHVPFRESGGRVWAEEFRCKGEETELWSCPRVPCPGGICHHSGAVQIVCSGKMKVRFITSPLTLFRWENKTVETLSSSTNVHRSPTHDKQFLSVWGAGGDEYFWTMESTLCLPLEYGQCQCCLSSAQLWSRHLHP